MPTPTPTKTASTSHTDRPTDETVKETLESIIVAFILAFVFRAYVVEAFVIPTGSMAPTLLGKHVAVNCDQCGYHFTSDPEDKDMAERLNQTQFVAERPYLTQALTAVCPMCHYPNRLPKYVRTSAGDRILVHKFIYSIAEPRRWDVVVFKNPQEPGINFIKRLIGLPEEQLWIIDGNIYTRSGDAPWSIARKTDRPKVQRAVWQRIYHSQYVPLDGGRGSDERRRNPWQTPWRAEEQAWDVEGRRSYRYNGAGEGRIYFDWSIAAEGGPTLYAYNQLKRPWYQESVEDIRVAAAVQPDSAGLSIEFQTTARLNDTPLDAPPQVLTARIAADGTTSLDVAPPGPVADGDGAGDGAGNGANSGATDVPASPPTRTTAGERIAPFAPGETREVEFWFVDQEASLWVDGRRVLVQRFEIGDIDAAALRPQATAFPKITIGVAGSTVTLHRVQVDRDLYYSSAELGAGRLSGQPGHGVAIKDLRRSESGQAVGVRGEPIALEADQFFCLGDNSPMSHDSRYWNSVDAWVEHRMLRDHQQRLGVVPRNLMMGRAFFVYFPAPFSLQPQNPGLFPNFGDMRFIH